MNSKRPLQQAPADDERFDRLVDGALSPEEYRALLASLDDEPDGWRKCALAFLEAQAWQQDFGNLVNRPHKPAAAAGERDAVMPQIASPAQTPGPTRNPGPTSRPFTALAWLSLALAANLLAALTIGVLIPQIFRPGAKEPVTAGNLHLPKTTTTASNAPAGGRHQVLRPVGHVTLVVEGDEAAGASGEVPVYEVSADLEDILAQDDAALGPDVIELFRRLGFDVHHQEQFAPAPLDDGRQVIVPLHGYEIRPVSRTY